MGSTYVHVLSIAERDQYGFKLSKKLYDLHKAAIGQHVLIVKGKLDEYKYVDINT